ncbi:MAG TPA: hypothetical protein VJ771_04720 [Candidatus Nitrosotalea sp.]|nr:hypothetical protein [Candidatus Nitrosotalea sp.]
MTKILLGIVMTAIVLYTGMTTQAPAMAMTEDVLSDAIKQTSLQSFGSSASMMLVATPPTHKGGETTFMLVPRPVENTDGIPIPKPAAPDTVLVVTSSGGHVTFTLVPKPVEGIDGIPVPKPTQQVSTMPAVTKVADPNPLMLVAVSPIHKGEKATLMWVPRPVENTDGLPPTKQAPPDMILVATSSGGKVTYSMVPKPVEGIDGIPVPKSSPSLPNP